MKKLFLSLALGLCGLMVFGQQGFHIGIFGMPQSTWIFNDRDIDPERSAFEYETTWGWAGMAKIGYNIGDPLGFHLGLIYSKQGQKNTALDSLGARVLTRRELTYVKIPLLIHINSDPGPVMLNLEIGPQLGFLMAASHSEDGILQNLGFDTDQFYMAKDFGVAWAIGAEFMLTEWLHFNLVHRGDYSLFDIENKEFLVGQSVIDPARDKANGCTLGIMGGFNFCLMPRGGGKRVKFWIR